MGTTAVGMRQIRVTRSRKRPLWPSGRFAVARPVPSSGNALRGRETILVVGNTPVLRGALARVLRQYGYQVLEASDALEAQRLTEARRAIQLLLMDLSSPETHDFQTALWFRSTHPEIKVLVASDALWGVNLELGVSQQIAVLAKPFTPVELARMVRRVLGRGFAA